MIFLPRQRRPYKTERLKNAESGSKVRELVVQYMSLHALCMLGDVFPNVEKLGMFASWYRALHADGMEIEGVMVSEEKHRSISTRIPNSARDNFVLLSVSPVLVSFRSCGRTKHYSSLI